MAFRTLQTPVNRSALPSTRAHRPDYSLLIAIYALLMWGLIVIFSMGPTLSQAAEISVVKQFIAIGVGTLGFIIASKFDSATWRKLLPLMIFASIVTTALLLVPGTVIADESNGATRWLQLGGISFQPSELIKITLIFFLASFLSTRSKHNKLDNTKATLIPVMVLITVIGLFVAYLQRDLGTMMVIAAIAVGMLYVAGMNFRNLSIVMLLGLVASASLVLIAPHRIARLTTFITPEADPMGTGYHIDQSLLAIGSGGISGLGIGKSIQSYGYLPEASNDSIFAVHAESIGFIGVLVLLGVFGYLLRRIHLHMMAAPNDKHRLIIAGIFMWIFSHIVVNIGAMLGLLPLTGITLPLLSYGGSSMVLIMIALGVVFHYSKYSSLGIIHSESTTRRRIR